MQNKIKVLYIAGCGRTGSTLLGNILGQVEGFTHVGELREMWSNLAPGRPPCGCGEPVRSCRMWNQVLKLAYGGATAPVASRMLPFLTSNTTRRAFLAAAKPPMTRALERGIARPLADLEKLYQAIQRGFNCEVIVDSSKRPMYMHNLHLMGVIDLYVVHLVRDPRAWAHAFLHRVAREGYVLHMNALASARHWNRRNWTFEILSQQLRRRPLDLRYEDFVANPRASLQRILNFVDAKSSSLPLQTEYSVDLRPQHTVSGNPNRFNTGVIEIREHCQWKTQMKRRDKVFVTAATLPLLMKYRYTSNARESRHLFIPSAERVFQTRTQGEQDDRGEFTCGTHSVSAVSPLETSDAGGCSGVDTA